MPSQITEEDRHERQHQMVTRLMTLRENRINDYATRFGVLGTKDKTSDIEIELTKRLDEANQRCCSLQGFVVRVLDASQRAVAVERANAEWKIASAKAEAAKARAEAVGIRVEADELRAQLAEMKGQLQQVMR